MHLHFQSAFPSAAPTRSQPQIIPTSLYLCSHSIYSVNSSPPHSPLRVLSGCKLPQDNWGCLNPLSPRPRPRWVFKRNPPHTSLSENSHYENLDLPVWKKGDAGTLPPCKCTDHCCAQA